MYVCEVGISSKEYIFKSQVGFDTGWVSETLLICNKLCVFTWISILPSFHLFEFFLNEVQKWGCWITKCFFMTPVNREYIGRSVLVSGWVSYLWGSSDNNTSGWRVECSFFPKPQGVSLAWWHSTSLVCSECSFLYVSVWVCTHALNTRAREWWLGEGRECLCTVSQWL